MKLPNTPRCHYVALNLSAPANKCYPNKYSQNRRSLLVLLAVWTVAFDLSRWRMRQLFNGAGLGGIHPKCHI